MTVPELLTRYTRPTVIAVVLMLSLVAVTSKNRTAAIERTVTTAITAVTEPAQRSFNAVGRRAIGLLVRDRDRAAIQKENAMLRRRLAKLGAVAVRARELEAENQRLRRLLAFRDSVEFETVPARVIGRDYSCLTIDRGADAGIRDQMCVLTSEGVVGRILNVSGHTAKVLLIWDSNSRLGGMVQRTRAQGVVEGDQDGRCIMRYLEASVDVRPYDLVVTSGEGGVFPKGLAVGRVIAVARREGELFQTATIEPLAELDRLEEVLVAVAERTAKPAIDAVTGAAPADQS